MNKSTFVHYFGIDQSGYWEKDHYVCFRKTSLEEYIQQYQLDLSFKATVKKWEEKMLENRLLRSAPRLDDKILCSWNALIGRGILKAATSFQNKTYSDLSSISSTIYGKDLSSKQGGFIDSIKKPPLLS